MWAWRSDGADLSAPLAATATFFRLAFNAWGESRSPQKVLANLMKRKQRNFDHGRAAGNG
eukprot:6058969-Pyramimonas_sp.AAC.1